ncbi:MAG: hypothetical protein WC071_07040 [Victivallaceae bacterium]
MPKKVILILSTVMFLFNFIVAAEKAQDLVNCKNPVEWEGMVKLNDQAKTNGSSFEMYGKYPTELICKQMIPVDFNKTYKLSVWMRSLDKQFPASGYFGLHMYDKDKKPINYNNVSVLPATETTLATAAAKGSKEISVVKNEAWPKQKYSSVAFDIKDNYEDLPNFDLARVDKFVDDGTQYKVILKSPLKKDYPAETRVRLHAPWGTPFYWVASDWMPVEWKQFSTVMKGESQSGTPRDKFWKGTRYVRVFAWFGNYNRIPGKEARLLVDDIKFTCE